MQIEHTPVPHTSESPDLHPISLRFIGRCAPLEPLFKAFHRRETIPMLPTAFLLGAAIVASFGILDAILLPLHKHITWAIRGALVAGTLITVWLMARNSRLTRDTERVAAVLVVSAGLGITLMICLIPLEQGRTFHSGIVLVLMYGYLNMGLRFLWATTVGFCVVLPYIFAALALEMPTLLFVNNVFVLMGANVMGGMMSYRYERSSRRTFFLLQRLAEAERFARLENQEQIRRLSLAVDQSPVLIKITDVKGNLEFVNRRFCEFTGFQPTEIIGKTPGIVRSASTPDAIYRELWSTIAQGECWEGDLLNKKKNGDEFWEHMTISPVRNDAGTITHYLAIGVDITEKRKLQHELQHAQKMEAVGRLAGGVAHDFNNLLMGISGNVEYVLSDLDPSDPFHEPLRDALSAAESASGLTRQLLAFSRKQVTEPKVLDLNEVIAKMEKLLRRLIGEDIALSTQMAADLGLVSVDPGQFEQILANLVVNARDAMPEGGEVIVSTRNAQLDRASRVDTPDFKPGTYIEVSVRDTGHGMSEEVKSRLFEPFFTTKAQGKGTGLGLATVYGIMRKHNGHIRVESEIGVGTCFHMYFPLSSAPPQAPKEESESTLVRGTESVFLVEDDEKVRDATVRLLVGLGYRLSVFPDAKTALAAAARTPEPPALLITDVILPGMNGRALSEALRERWPSLRVLFVSGYTADVISQHGVLEEGISFLAKPFRLATLARKVRDTLDGL